MSNIKERLLEFIKSKNLTVAEFERRIGVSNGYVKNISKSIPPSKIEKITSIFPDLNTQWLLFGSTLQHFDVSETNFTEKLKDFEQLIKDNSSNIPDAALKLVQTILKDNTLNSNVETRPRIPYTAAAGTLTNTVEGITAEQCEQIPRIVAFPNYDFTIIIKGNSMEPKYEGGDEVACKRIDSTSFIQWGKVHVLDTAQGIIIKRVYDDGDCIRCASYNPEYPDFSVNKEEIYSMSLIVGLLRM